jgi:thioester reductase-like protein
MIEDRVQPVVGDLSKPLLGMSEEKFAELSNLLDLIVHNGAVVHWMYPYEKLKAANVLGTQEILRLACRGKKLTPVHYISTTSVFDSDQYSNLTDVFEDSTLPYHEDLRGGYPQSKFVAERLVMAARKRGLPAAIYRCGYVTGHSQTGVWNPDDYLCRMIKGCIQMGVFPDFPTTKLDLSPVDFVSRAIVYLILHKESLTKHKAYHLVNPNEFFFNDLFQTAVRLGYKIKPVDVEVWKKALFDSVAQKAADDEDRNALYPMLTYFSDDFGARMRTAKRPWYDNTNTLDGLKNSGITCPSVLELMTTYYRFLCQCQFLLLSPAALRLSGWLTCLLRLLQCCGASPAPLLPLPLLPPCSSKFEQLVKPLLDRTVQVSGRQQHTPFTIGLPGLAVHDAAAAALADCLHWHVHLNRQIFRQLLCQ